MQPGVTEDAAPPARIGRGGRPTRQKPVQGGGSGGVRARGRVSGGSGTVCPGWGC